MKTALRCARGPLGPDAGAACCFIVPPGVVAEVADKGRSEARRAAIRTLGASAALRARRSVVTHVLRQLNLGVTDLALVASPTGESQTVYDAQHQGSFGLPGTRARGENDPPIPDQAVNEAFDGTDRTYRFYQEVFQRNGIDGEGLPVVSSVHYGQEFDNALWNGAQMIYGDGSGQIMASGSLTKAVDIMGHELTHGVTQATSALQYHHQSGALNESFSDVLGSLVKQYVRGQTADQADWLIGEGVLGSALQGRALRSLKDPGQAFDMDRQPGHMSGYVDLPDDNDPGNDNGGVHLNSGIPNHAFYLVATALGGHAWEKAGKIWYVTLTQALHPDADFVAAANATAQTAAALFGAGSDEQRAVQDAWQQVGVLRPGDGEGLPPAPSGTGASSDLASELQTFLRGAVEAAASSRQEGAPAAVLSAAGPEHREEEAAWSPTRYDSIFWCRSRFLCNPQSLSCLC